jgi:hypothetical protein
MKLSILAKVSFVIAEFNNLILSFIDSLGQVLDAVRDLNVAPL